MRTAAASKLSQKYVPRGEPHAGTQEEFTALSAGSGKVGRRVKRMSECAK